MEFLTDPSLWGALLTLTVLEIVLGIDNIVFISILAGKLPDHQQSKARTLGLAGAMLTRIGLLFSLSFIMSLTEPLFQLPVLAHDVSGRDLILLLGGLFLIYKSCVEIYEKVEGTESEREVKARTSLMSTVIQIMFIDIVFSLDSVITAVGMVNNLPVMIAAIVIAVFVMMLASGSVSAFITKHPSIKILALSFLLLIGVLLIAEGGGAHVPKAYVYVAMAFSFLVEILNIRMKGKHARNARKNKDDADRNNDNGKQ